MLAKASLSSTCLVGAGCIFLAVSYAYFNWIENYFFVTGAPFLDAGLLADLIWRNPYWDPRLPNFLGGWPFSAAHFSPILNISNGISYLLPLEKVPYFALFQATLFALLPFLLALFLCSSAPTRSWSLKGSALAVCFLFGFNGFYLGTLELPHFEMVWPAMAFGFFWCLFKKQIIVALIFFSAILLVREDAGLHVAGVLVTILVYRRITKTGASSEKLLFTFTACAVAYSVAVLLFQKVYFASHTFSAVYSGMPPYAHVTIQTVIDHLKNLETQAPSLLAAFAVAAGFAILDRRPAYLLGFFAGVPWLILHLLAPIQQSLFGYRLFPFVLASVWPILEKSRTLDFRLGPRAARSLVLYLAVLSGSTMAAFQYGTGASPTWYASFLPSRLGAENFEPLSRLLESRNHQRTLLLQDYVISLEPRRVTERNLFTPQNWQRANVVLFWHKKLSQDESRLIFSDFGFLYSVSDTPIRIASKDYLDIAEEPRNGYRRLTALEVFFELGPGVAFAEEGATIAAHHENGPVVYGPYVRLEPGLYRATFRLLASGPTEKSVHIDVAANFGALKLAEIVTGPADFGGSFRDIDLFFQVNSAQVIEFRVFKIGNAAIVVSEITFKREAD